MGKRGHIRIKKKGVWPNTTDSMNERIRKHMDDISLKSKTKIDTTIITKKQQKDKIKDVLK